MEELWSGFVRAIGLIASCDAEVIEVTRRTLMISVSSCSIVSAISIPLGSLIHFNQFRGKRALISVIQTLYSVPTVVVGLMVFLVFSRAGPLGDLKLLFTPAVMIIGQVILITPLMLGLIVSALSGMDKAVAETAISLGATRFQMVMLILKEAKFAVMAAIIMGFGRAFSEVGLALMVGGNIRGFTRTLTTTISLETSKGDLELSIALGIILLLIALAINVTLNRLQQR
ncbi:MAG: ABC transporter permease [Dehalococcoidales bacterium]|nr:ABC transporter permease [Dehalococcoidales bacterium]